MMDQIKILKIEPKGAIARLSISNLKQPLFVTEITLHKNKLVAGIIITESQLRILLDDDDLYRCEQKATRYLANREHSVGEIKNKLRTKQFLDKNIATVISKLLRLDYLNDQRYAENLVRKIVEQKPSGKGYILAHLKRKLIDSNTSRIVVDRFLVEVDLKEQAVRALEKRWRQWQDLELETAQKKAYNYLSRRGFNYEAAKFAFERLKTSTKED